MKKLLQSLPRFFENLCVSFTISTLVYAPLGAQGSMMRRGWLYEILSVCVVAILLQHVFFVSKAARRLSYLLRMALFALLMAAAVCGFALLYNWFPAAYLEAWLLFLGMFLAGFVVIALVFEVWLRLKGRAYDEALGRYKREKSR